MHFYDFLLGFSKYPKITDQSKLHCRNCHDRGSLLKSDLKQLTITHLFYLHISLFDCT